MSSLYIDTHIEVIELILNKKDGSGSTYFYIGLDFWTTGAAYTGSPTIYPVLVAPPVITRSVGINVANRQDVSFQVYGKSHFQSYGVGFADLLELYEPINSQVNFYYYPRPKDAAQASTSDNIRLKTKIIGYSTDDINGILNIDTREVWFNDKELSKELRADVFADLDPKWDGEIGSRVFGAFSSSDGIIIDAPVIQSGIVSSTPTATLFTGWTNVDYPNHAKKKIFVRMQENRVNTREWLELDLSATPQVHDYGDDSISSGDWSIVSLRSLSNKSVMGIIPFATLSPKAKIITAVKCGLYPLPNAWAIGFDGSSDWCVGNGPAATWQPNESEDFSFTIAGWVYLNSKSTTQVLVCTHSDAVAKARSWAVYYDHTADRFRCQTYNSAGTALDNISANNLGSPSTATWYFIQARLDGTGNTLKIRANSGTWDSMAITGDAAESKAGIRFGALRTGGALANKLNGYLQAWSFHDDAISDSVLDHYYNSGDGRLYVDVGDNYKEDLVAYWDFDDILIKECKDKHGSHDLKITGTPTADYGKIATTVTSEDGELSLSVYYAHLNSTTATYEPIGSPIRTSKIDVDDVDFQAGDGCYFQIPPLAISDATNGDGYALVLEWSNHRNQSKAILFKDKVGISGPTDIETYYKNEYGEKEQAWKFSGKNLEMAVYCVGEGSGAWSDGDSDPFYSSSQQFLEAKSITLLAGQSHQEFALDFEFKVGLEGLEDDGSGHFTGSAGGALKNPSSIIQLLEQAADFGMSIADAGLDLTAMSALRTLDDMGIVVDRPMSVKELIVNICRQSRLVFWVKRDGKLSLYKPTYTASGWTLNLSESAMRGDLVLLGVADDDDSNTVNSFRILYSPDVLNQTKDAAFLRRAKTDKYDGLAYMNGNESSSGDARRQALCAASQALYGERQMNESHDFYDSSTVPEKNLAYYCDRYALKLSKGVVRIPRQRYYNLADLFTTAQIQHSGTPATNGTGFDMRSFNVDAGVTYYYEGVKSSPWAGGSIAGEIIEVSEEGPYMTLTVQTMNPF